MVMYLGHVVETGNTNQVFAPPYHPYTEALLSAVPIADTSVKRKHIVLKGDIPSAVNPPSGCPFQTRCQHKHLVENNLCEKELPDTIDVANGHQLRCHLSSEHLAAMKPVIKLAGDSIVVGG
jgi:peptide/nickel transport system ATP-binding protein